MSDSPEGRDPYDPVEVLVNEWRSGHGPRRFHRWIADRPGPATALAVVSMVLIPTVPAVLALRSRSWLVVAVIVVAAAALAVVAARTQRANVDTTRRAVERFDAECGPR